MDIPPLRPRTMLGGEMPLALRIAMPRALYHNNTNGARCYRLSHLVLPFRWLLLDGGQIALVEFLNRQCQVQAALIPLSSSTGVRQSSDLGTQDG